ncbi:Integrase catalytic domain-containing protein, partial [Aphis craccivora]
CEEELDDHHDLLLCGDGTGKKHYCRVTNLSKLVGAQLSRHGHAMSICKRCFKTYSGVNAHQQLNDHKLKCITNKFLLLKLPPPNTFMKFENWERTQKHPFSIFADFECILEKNNDLNEMKNTNITHHHDLMSYCYYIKPSENIPIELLEKFNISTEPVLFRGDSSLNKGEVAKKFMEDIVEVGRNIDRLLNTNIPLVMTNENNKKHREVADHGTCPFCKIHNLSGYDSHFLITQLGFDTKSINVMPNIEEKLISFTKYISNSFQLRFVDSFRFMATNLEKLVNNLGKGGNSKFRETRKIFSENDIDLVTRKGFYPYEYTDSWEKLNETTLPPKEKFYSSLNEIHISNDDYEYAKIVWNQFNCNTLDEYSDWYLKVDVMLLVDCFEKDLCLKTYGLDPNYYYTSPGMSFDCMLKYTKVNLELLSDYDQILMFEQGIRGGLTHAVKRYAEANNIKVPDYDASKPESWIVYLDATNLYGWAMSRSMPKDGFGWFNDDLTGVEKIKSKGIRYHVVKNHLTKSDHKKCLFFDGIPPETNETRNLTVEQSKQFELTGFTSTTNQYTPFRINKSLRSFKHELKTISSVKLTLNRCDDKRIVCEDQIHTIAHGNYLIQEAEEVERIEADLAEMVDDIGY